MKKELIDILLNGMSVPFFLAMFILALLGVSVFFVREIINAIKYDKRTPEKFDFKSMFKMSALRIFIGLVAICVSIVYFGEMSKLMFQVEEPLEINGFVAFSLGIGIDRLLDGILGWGKDGGKFLWDQGKKAINGNHQG
jgi:hypothetical protein